LAALQDDDRLEAGPDAGCGPGLVSEALAAAGCSVLGVDLSAEMIRRARVRCARFDGQTQFRQASVFDLPSDELFDGAISRYVIHHLTDPGAFIRRQVEHLRPGASMVACDHTTDPDSGAAAAHQTIERARDRSHTRNLTPGGLLDLFAASGLSSLELREDPFTLDFDEWFDRGTPSAPKATVREQVLAARARGFRAMETPDGAVVISCWRAYVRGVKA
jgi:SAM-dependent methyltransferase